MEWSKDIELRYGGQPRRKSRPDGKIPEETRSHSWPYRDSPSDLSFLGYSCWSLCSSFLQKHVEWEERGGAGNLSLGSQTVLRIDPASASLSTQALQIPWRATEEAVQAGPPDIGHGQERPLFSLGTKFNCSLHSSYSFSWLSHSVGGMDDSWVGRQRYCFSNISPSLLPSLRLLGNQNLSCYTI